MRKFIKLLALIMVFAILLATTASAVAFEETNVNAEQDDREREIKELLAARREIIFEGTVDVVRLNEIDLQLHELGVEFLSESEVAEEFPEAKAAIDEITDKDVESAEDNTLANRGIDLPVSNLNSWSTYRVTRYYNGQYYNVQQLVVQPLGNNGTPLWEESSEAVSVRYSLNWEAGITNFLTSVASIGLSTLAPITMTVYDVLESVVAGLTTTTIIDPDDAIYSWENKTEAVFSYVRMESQSDDYQQLVLISTCCETYVGYIVDIDEWIENEDGVMLEKPARLTGDKYIYSTPTTYESASRACYAYENWSGGPVSDQITSITISGPESTAIVVINPPILHFPGNCEP